MQKRKRTTMMLSDDNVKSVHALQAKRITRENKNISFGMVVDDILTQHFKEKKL